MALTEEQRKQIAADAVREAEVREAEVKANMVYANRILDLESRQAQADVIANLMYERDEWKRRAEQHGCDVVNGDPDCG